MMRCQIIAKMLRDKGYDVRVDGDNIFINHQGREVQVVVEPPAIEFDIPGITEATGHRFRIPAQMPMQFSSRPRKRDLPFDKSYLKRKGRYK